MKFINILTKLMYPIRKERFVMKIYNVIILLLLFMGCNKNDTNETNETTALNKTNPIGNYGKMIELKTVISIDQLLANPGTYLEKKVMIATGKNKETNLVEIVEIPEHPWFVGVQFHPEYKSTVSNPHPLFVSFIKACINKSK